MAIRHHRTDTSAESWARFGPSIALAAWSSLLTGANSRAVGELGAIAGEWQDFVNRRVKEDVDLLRRLTHSTSPDQVLTAYADFWRKAGEDYGNVLTTMTKLMTDITSKMAVATRSATEEARTKLFR